MLSWVFRNRRRLRVIYGVPPAPPATPRRTPAVPPAARPTPAGAVLRRRGYVLLRPMPRRAG